MRIHPAFFLMPACLALACASGPRAHLSPHPPVEFQSGVNIHQGPAALLELAPSAGLGWVRLDLDWPSLEPSPGIFDWSRSDPAVDQACGLGLKVMAVLLRSPPWASPSQAPQAVPDPAAWRAFVGAAARRYEGRIQAYAVWNEPNLEEFWLGSVDDYVQVLLIPAGEAIREADPGAMVAGPELAHLFSGRIPPQDFLARFQALGGGGLIDLFTHHAYGGDDFEQKILGLHFAGFPVRPGLLQMLRESGLWGKPVWITEFGVDARVGERDQARLLRRQWKFLREQGWVGGAMVYEWVDDPAAAEKWGLLRSDGTAREALGASR